MKLRYLVLVAIIVNLAVPMVAGQDNVFKAEFELNTYVDTRIIISYAFTQNVTSDAFSMGMSVAQSIRRKYGSAYDHKRPLANVLSYRRGIIVPI